MPDRGHGIVFRESGSAKRIVAMQILRATASRAVQILGDLNVASVPLKVIRRTEHRWNSSTSNSTKRDDLLLARRVGPALMIETLLISIPSSGFSLGQGRNTTVVVGNAFYLDKPGIVRRQLDPVESHFGACAIPPLTIT